MNWKRARSEEQKEKRILEIINATADLYNKMNYEEITFVKISKEAKFTRSNLYKYFKNKEEIFLEFIKHDLSSWRKDVFNTFEIKKYSSMEFAELWVDLVLKHKRLIELFTILFTFIEKKASLEYLISFKQTIFEENKIIADFLFKLYPHRTVDEIYEFIYAEFALSIGIYPMLNLTEVQIKAMEFAGSTSDSTYFKNIYIKSIEALVEKMLN